MRHEGQVCHAERYRIALGSSVAGNPYFCYCSGSGRFIEPTRTKKLALEWEFLCYIFGSSTPNHQWDGESLSVSQDIPVSPGLFLSWWCCFLGFSCVLPAATSPFDRSVAVSVLEMNWEFSRQASVQEKSVEQ